MTTPHRDRTAAERFTIRQVLAAAVLWVIVVGGGMLKLWSYAYTAGPAAQAPASWPITSAIARDPVRPTLVMFVHPQCSCSVASVGELARLMAHEQGRVDAQVLVYRPAAEPPAWTHSDLWHAAEAIPGVRVFGDDEGAAAQDFGAVVSGDTFLYATDGRLVFSGGITIARGHAGDSAGRLAIQSWLDRPAETIAAVTPAFGCVLREERP
jgi:hypothetical protein